MIESVTKDGGLTVISLSGGLDLYFTPDLKKALADTFAEADVKTLHLDFSEVNRIDSSIIGALLGAAMVWQRAGRTLLLCNLPPIIERTLKSTRVHGFLVEGTSMMEPSAETYSHAVTEVLELSRKEQKDVRDTVTAYENAAELARKELIALRSRISSSGGTTAEQLEVFKALEEDPFNEKNMLEQLEQSRTSHDTPYADLFQILVNCSFTEDEARTHWFEIRKHQEVLSTKLNRLISFRVALMDYFIYQNKILENPKIIELKVYEDVLRRSLQDELTGLYNRRFMTQSLEREISRSKRHTHMVSFVMLDLDDFKKYNDRFGHAEGDRLLTVFGHLLRDYFRSEDIPCRYGGEEFAIVLPETDPEHAIRSIERLYDEAAKVKLPTGGVLGFSGGVAAFPGHAEDAELLIRTADRALYEAKNQGKNRVLMAEVTVK